MYINRYQDHCYCYNVCEFIIIEKAITYKPNLSATHNNLSDSLWQQYLASKFSNVLC